MKRKRAATAIVQQPGAQFYHRFSRALRNAFGPRRSRRHWQRTLNLFLHYWEIGRDILENQKRQGWGAKVIDRLAADLQREFPKLSGYSVAQP